MKDKLLHVFHIVWAECKDVKTLVVFGIVFAVLYTPTWLGYLLYLIFDWGWCAAVATAYIVFWAGPFTPLLPICFAITLAIKRKMHKKENADNSEKTDGGVEK